MGRIVLAITAGLALLAAVSLSPRSRRGGSHAGAERASRP